MSEGFESLAKAAFTWFALGVEALTAVLIFVASVRATVQYFGNLLRHRGPLFPSASIRLSLGRSLALSLELSLGADILKTAVAPTWNDIGQLAAIAIIRTALNFFLERELASAEGAEPGWPWRYQLTEGSPAAYHARIRQPARLPRPHVGSPDAYHPRM